MTPQSNQRSYWASVWADPEVAPQILQHGRIFAVTQRNFKRTLDRTFGSLENRRILDFGCGDGQLLSWVRCRTRLLFEPSPVYASALAKLAARDSTVQVLAGIDEIRPATVDLVVVHGVAHYLSSEELFKALLAFRSLLGQASLGVVIADLPHSNRLVDTIGALFAHPATLLQTVNQVLRLSRTRYASDRIERYRVRDLEALSSRAGFQLRRLKSRSFNRARSTILLETT